MLKGAIIRWDNKHLKFNQYRKHLDRKNSVGYKQNRESLRLGKGFHPYLSWRPKPRSSNQQKNQTSLLLNLTMPIDFSFIIHPLRFHRLSCGENTLMILRFCRDLLPGRTTLYLLCFHDSQLHSVSCSALRANFRSTKIKIDQNRWGRSTHLPR